MSGRPWGAPRGVAGAAALIAALLGLAGCEDLLQEPDTGAVPPLVQVEPVAGDQQTAPAGEALPAPLRVRAIDREGRPIARLRVEWTPLPGAGRAEPRNSFTDADGIAETTWILGPGAGEQELWAGPSAASAAVFHATAVP